MTTATAAIVPHTNPLAKGVDICGNETSVYIIRSDLSCYMKCDCHLDFPKGQDGQKFEIYPLHPSFAFGDHYLVGPKDTFYIIKNNQFIVASDLSAPTTIPMVSQDLSPLCQNGENYLFIQNYFMITKKDQYILTSDLTSNSPEQTGTVYGVYLQYGKYYFGARSQINVITENPDWGVIFTLTSSLSSSGQDHYVYPDVINFLPGGISVALGTTAPKWQLLKTFTNSKDGAALSWSEKITKTVGFNKSSFQSIEQNWEVTSSVSMGTKFESGFLLKNVIETQFSLTTSFGGASIQSKQEDWNEAYTVEEQLSTTIQPGKSVYIWQFRLGLKGSDDVLFCRDLQITDTSVPPSNIPLPLIPPA